MSASASTTAVGDMAEFVRDDALHLVGVGRRLQQAGMDVDGLFTGDEGVDRIVVDEDDLDVAGLSPAALTSGTDMSANIASVSASRRIDRSLRRLRGEQGGDGGEGEEVLHVEGPVRDGTDRSIGMAVGQVTAKRRMQAGMRRAVGARLNGGECARVRRRPEGGNPPRTCYTPTPVSWRPKLPAPPVSPCSATMAGCAGSRAVVGALVGEGAGDPRRAGADRLWRAVGDDPARAAVGCAPTNRRRRPTCAASTARRSSPMPANAASS